MVITKVADNYGIKKKKKELGFSSINDFVFLAGLTRSRSNKNLHNQGLAIQDCLITEKDLTAAF